MSDKAKDILEWIFCIVIALVLALLFRYFIATPTIVQQKSMYPTFKPQERLILNRTFRITKKQPKVGDVVTFEAPDKVVNPSENLDQSNPIAHFQEEKKGLEGFIYYKIEITKRSYIKRLIATEGQHVEIKDGKVFIDGKQLDESAYLASDVVTESNVYNDFVVPKGYVFCMGDNRKDSIDCRMLGCIPIEKLEGTVVFRFWPFDVWGSV